MSVAFAVSLGRSYGPWVGIPLGILDGLGTRTGKDVISPSRLPRHSLHPTDPTTMRVLLIEDSARLPESLREGFTRAGFAIDVVGDGGRGLVFAKREHYDAIILDLTLPDLDGIELLRELRAGGSDTCVLILTARNSVEDRVRGLNLGADDYLSKPFSFDELLARVEALVRRRYRSKESVVQIGDLALDAAARRVMKGDVDVRLTKREFRVFEYLARRRGQVVTRLEIEDHIYSEENLPESNAVESAISTIRKKLKVAGSDSRHLLQTRYGLGYFLEEEKS
jgi:DNA-binding response OmpR family regulator